MNSEFIGVDVDDFRLPPRDAFRQAAELGFRSVEFATVAGDLAPQQLSHSGRRHLLRVIEGFGLQTAALVADVPGQRLTDPRTVEERVTRTLQVIDLAADLDVRIITASVGALTHPESGAISELALEALRRMGEYADDRGRIFALRPSHDAGERLESVLKAVGCPAIQVGLDPAALIMSGVSPLEIVQRFAQGIALVHARDGSAGGADHSGRETRLGEGDVDFETVLASLEAAQYRGAYILRRTDSQTPSKDLQEGLDRLRKIMR